MHLAIRPVSESDAAAVCALSAQLGYTISVADTLLQVRAIHDSANDVACVATDDDEIVGWIHIFHTIRLECLPYCEIGGLVVDEKYRGQGIGKKLIENIKPWCREKGRSALRVRSNIKRHDAHGFYTGAGFREIKQQKVFEIKL